MTALERVDGTARPHEVVLAAGQCFTQLLGHAAADPAQLTLFAPPEQVVAALLRDLDLDQLAPLAALNLLHTLKSRLS